MRTMGSAPIRFRFFLPVSVLAAILALAAPPMRPACAASPSAAVDPAPEARIPWGDLVFLDDQRLLVPYAIEEPASDEARRQARADFEQWQNLPVERAVDALLEAAKSAKGPFARPLAEIFVRYLQRHPDVVHRQLEGERWVRELGLRLMRIEQGRLREVRRIPLWAGWQHVDDRAEVVPGGSARIVRDANLRVGVRVGPHWIVAWVPENFPGAASFFLDPASLEVLAVEPGFVPLAWLGGERLLGWRRNERGVPMVGIYALSAPGEFHALGGAASGRKLMQTRPLYHGAPPLAATVPPGSIMGAHERLQPGSREDTPTSALICLGSRLAVLDLRSGQTTAVLPGNVWLGCPLAEPPLTWAMVDRPGGPRLLALETRAGTLHEVRTIRLPQPGFWFGPVATRRGSIFLLRDPGTETLARGGSGATSRTTSRRGELWRFDADSGRWLRLSPPFIDLDGGKMSESARLLAVDPGGHHLALRIGSTQLRLLVLPASIQSKEDKR